MRKRSFCIRTEMRQRSLAVSGICAVTSEATEKKVYIAKGVKYFSNIGVAEFLMETQNLRVGDKVLITGPTTGAITTEITEIRVNLKPVEETVKGERFSIRIPEKIRPSDKMFKLVSNPTFQQTKTTEK